MFIQFLMTKDLYSKYKFLCEGKLFNDVQSFIFHLIGVVNKWSQENTELNQQLSPEIAYSIVSKFHISLSFVLSLESEQLLNQFSSEFQLTDLEKETLRSLIFNFGLKSFIENDFGHKFIRFAFELMENRLKEIKEFENAQKESLAKISKGTLVPIQELEPIILNFINSQFQNYPEFKYLNNVQDLINRKKEYFPEIFTTGKPKTIAFNEFIYGLYLLISERNSNYMPFIKYVVDELNQINPKYFERNNISVEALRKKVKDQIKLNSK